ncbi:MAG: BrnT family toxin, partial [Lachnospiraceae bacterium]|nr:BrnT family toxin [Lachnospiraceae bacterium]
NIDGDRFITIGMADEVLFVVYTERQTNIRLISARLATAKERGVYYGIV